MKATKSVDNTLQKKAISLETFVFLGVSLIIFGYLGHKMGIGIMFSVMMKTAHDLILNTAIFIMGVAVLAGAAAALMSEFGIIALANKLLYPIMKPLFGLPGAASLGAVTTYISDNPAILSLAEDKGFSKYFKKYERVSLVNLGTVFGMGLIVTSYVLGLGNQYIPAIIIGNICAILGGVVSVRLMLFVAKKAFKGEEEVTEELDPSVLEYRKIREGSIFQRVLSAMLEGGKTGVDLGLSVIPGIVVVCTTVMMLTFGPTGAEGAYEGVAYEGVALLPKLGDLLSPIITPMFGFSSSEALALPITSLGAVGAAMGMAKGLLETGLMNAHDIAVFSAIGICWAGFMSTHVGLMDAIGSPRLAGKAMLTHLVGGLCAGVFANYMFLLFC
jgi:hypothetical protein